jgi:NADH:ubiquinone oxidoreductase subunit K
VNINLIGYVALRGLGKSYQAYGQVLIIFVITIAAAELALAIAIILRLYRNTNNVNVDEIKSLKG